jgi:hypothetical protein
MMKPHNHDHNKKPHIAHSDTTTTTTAHTNTKTNTTKTTKHGEQPERGPQLRTHQLSIPDNSSDRRTAATTATAATAATNKGKTLKEYEKELNTKLRITQQEEEQDQLKTRTTPKDKDQEEHQKQNLRTTQHVPFEDYYYDDIDIDEDLLHLLTYDSDDYDSTSDPFYDSDDDSAYDPFYTCNDESYNTNPAPELPTMPPEYIPFSNYADRCLATCSNLKRHQAMDSRLELLFNAYIQGKLPVHNIDWDNMPLLTSDPNGELTPTDFCYTYLSRPDPDGRDPPGTLLPSHDNLSYIGMDPRPQDPSLLQDPAGTSFPATWTYPPPPSSDPFTKQTNSPPPFPTLGLLPVNDIDKIDNTWTAKALATVANTLLWNTATPVGRWAYVPPLKKLRSKKMMMDAHAAAAA